MQLVLLSLREEVYTHSCSYKMNQESGDIFIWEKNRHKEKCTGYSCVVISFTKPSIECKTINPSQHLIYDGKADDLTFSVSDCPDDTKTTKTYSELAELIKSSGEEEYILIARF